jgi:tetratricopeptide (TPR) repeat protein
MRTKYRVIYGTILIFILLLTQFCSGCTGLFPTSSTTQTTTSTQTAISTHITTATTTTVSLTPIQIGTNVLYKDDFSDSHSGWLTGAKDTGDFYYESGEYSLLELKTQYLIYANMDKNIGSDYAIQVDVRFLDLGKNGNCGIIFRQQGENENAEYYLYAINNDSFRLYVRFGGNWRAIQEWEKSEYIHPSPNTNHLLVACLGSQIDVYANGNLLGTYIDNTLAGNKFGLEAAEANTHVHFDNLAIYDVKTSGVTPGPPDLAREYYDKAVQYRKNGDYTNALTYYQKAIAEYYWYYEAWYEEAQTFYEDGEYEESLNSYYTVTEINPQDSNAWVDEGKCLEALGRNDDAMSCYNRALKIDPDNAQAKADKDALLAKGIADNNNDPPEKQYDNTHPLKLTGPVMVIHLKEGEPFSTSFSVEGGQPPYHWWLITTNGVADSVMVAGEGADGSTATVSGVAAMIDSPSTTSREATIEIGVEDSSGLTRQGKGSFWLHVDNQDDSEIAAQVAKEWYASNYGDINSIMQQAMAGVGYGGASESYGKPIALPDGTYQVTITIKAMASAKGVSVGATMDIILTIDTKTREVTNVTWGSVSMF